MKILTARNAFWPVLVALAAVIGYVVVSTQLAWYQHIPYVSLALLLGALLWSVGLLRQRKSVGRFVGLALTLVLASFFSWWTLADSEYENKEAAVDDGQTVVQLADMTLRDHAGIERPVLAEDSATLLVLYRGHW